MDSLGTARHGALTAFLCVSLFLGACATNRPAITQTTSPFPANHESHGVVSMAVKMVGTPYRYGGNTPNGFDCSGLVQYVYSQVGVSLPRSAAEQFKTVPRAPVNDLRPGDIVFFRVSRRKVSHVGIYVDEGSFVHAPSSGKRVAVR